MFRLPRGIHISRISWNDPTTLAIACGKTIKIVTISTDVINEHHSATPRKRLNISE